MKSSNLEMRETAPSAPIRISNERWLLEGSEITDFTLRDQRMYHQEEDGTWTRPKGGGSWNSINA